MSARHQVRMWRNGRGGRWTCRIRWYQIEPIGCPDPSDIRLNLDTVSGSLNMYPKDKPDAQNIWDLFRLVHKDCAVRDGCPSIELKVWVTFRMDNDEDNKRYVGELIDEGVTKCRVLRTFDQKEFVVDRRHVRRALFAPEGPNKQEE